MEPKIITKEAFLIAGVAGSGDETAKVWQTYMKLEKMNPLKNQVGEAGYEVRMYPGEESMGKIHVGVQVKDSNVPKEYKLFFMPAATYAEFEIYPAKGYESSNAEMSKWLEDNTGTYKEALLDGLHFGIEVYDKRFKGNDNPESVVGFLVPIVKVDPNFDIMQTVSGPMNELAGRIGQFAGEDVSKKVMRGKDGIIAAKDPVKGALWMKEAIDRLDTLIDKDTRQQIMTACGCSCNKVNHKDSEEARQLRMLCASEEDFLAMMEPPGNGVRYEREGKTLFQYYTPGKYKQGLRCYCSLINALPKGFNASPTYCQCARAFTEQHWSYALGRPVKVELGETAITGAEECKFIIHL
ncbi:MAG: GyrI-like domain-containing protein [Dehalococcoidales bacterium]|nr:GyrI-like domain-containing protein [Dehalococcoidales bacterium]